MRFIALTWKYTLKQKHHLPNCSKEHNIATFVFWQPSLEVFHWIPWLWKHTLRHKNNLEVPSCTKEQDMATIVFWRPSHNAQGYMKDAQQFLIEECRRCKICKRSSFLPHHDVEPKLRTFHQIIEEYHKIK